MMLEQEIEQKLQRLQGKVPTIIIKELQDKLVSKMDILTPERVDLIIDEVLKNYSSQVERLTKLDKRVEEIGKYLKEIRGHLVGASSVNISPANEITNQEDVEPSTLEKGVEFKEEEKKIRIYIGRCIFCSQCNDVCPVDALHMSKEFLLASDNKLDENFIVE